MVDQKIKKKKISQQEIDLALIENFVMMQKSLTNLTIKFDTLSDNISKLLTLFEVSARTFIRKQEGMIVPDTKEDKDLLNKIDSLLDQNKTIAKGLTLIEEKIRHKNDNELPTREIMSMESAFGEKPRPKPLPRI
jgi:hypothetical protein